MAQSHGEGWVDYMWPKPGESVSTLKSTYVSQVKLGEKELVVGCGVYLAEAPRQLHPEKKMTAPELMKLVHEAADLFAKKGDHVFAEFRAKGSKWFHDETYLFVWTMDGKRVFHAPNPETEGQDVRGLKDILGRPVGKMGLEIGESPSGEGWMHYMQPEPSDVFPTWKSTFLKRVNDPAGKPDLIGCGIYRMRMDKSFIEDIVDRATALITERGKEAFGLLRDKTGPFVFMDTYVFVESMDGVELVNPILPNLEGKNLLDLKDLKGRSVAREQIAAIQKNDSAWLDVQWYKPGQNTPARKQTFIRKAIHGGETFIVGSGVYLQHEKTVSQVEDP